MKLSDFYQKYRLQILLTAGLRVFYSIWLAVVWIVLDRFIPVTAKSLWESYLNLTPSSSLLGRSLIDVWLRWDAVHYMNIAAFGYQGVGAPDTIFFPLYPYLVGGLSRLTTLNVTVAGILLSSLAAVFALICLYELVVHLFHDEELAKWTTVLLAVYPAAFFLHAPFTDALFLLFVIASILMMVKQKYLMAGLLACAAGLTRPQGVLLLIPMAVLYVQGYLKDRKAFRWREILAIVIAPLGFIAYSVLGVKTGSAGLFQSLNQYSNIRFQNPLTTLYQTAVTIVKTQSFIKITELFLVLLFLAILIWMFFQRDFRRQPALMLYSAATWLLIASKSSPVVSTVQFSNRYILYIFFAFVGMAAILQKASPRLRNFVVLVFLILGLLIAILYSVWIYVG